mmetsp:Transcript_10136/g.17245  ORF Transcript_10136/g.17245 Transcript_10136/m.17245 type:complete len:234 (-) Transcript_10136:380-1081(-)
MVPRARDSAGIDPVHQGCGYVGCGLHPGGDGLWAPDLPGDQHNEPAGEDAGGDGPTERGGHRGDPLPLRGHHAGVHPARRADQPARALPHRLRRDPGPDRQVPAVQPRPPRVGGGVAGAPVLRRVPQPGRRARVPRRPHHDCDRRQHKAERRRLPGPAVPRDQQPPAGGAQEGGRHRRQAHGGGLRRGRRRRPRPAAAAAAGGGAVCRRARGGRPATAAPFPLLMCSGQQEGR